MVGNMKIEVDTKKLDQRLIRNVLKYIKDTDNVEKHFAFELISQDLIKHTKELNKLGSFDKFLQDNDAKKKAKAFWRSGFKKEMASIMHIMAETDLDGIQYSVKTKIAGPLKSYCEALMKRKMHKYLNSAQMIYVKVERLEPSGEVKVLIELGDTKAGNEYDRFE